MPKYIYLIYKLVWLEYLNRINLYFKYNWCFDYWLAIFIIIFNIYIFSYFRQLQNILYTKYFYILNFRIINIFKYINLIQIYSDIRNISSWNGFSSDSLDTKVLNMFGYLTNFSTVLVLLFLIGSDSSQFFRFRIFP